MKPITSYLGSFFTVFLRGQTYLGLIYNALAFPLGLLYFIFLITGFALGFSTLIIWVGLLILAAMFPVCWALASFERWQAVSLVKEEIPPMSRTLPAGATTWERIKAHLGNPVTWTSMVYLFLKFPLGLFIFMVHVALGSLAVVCISAIILFPFLPLQVWFTNTSYWSVDTLPKALILFVVGLFVLLVTMNISNLLAWISGKFARFMLGQVSAPPVQVAAPPVQVSAPPVQVAAPPVLAVPHSTDPNKIEPLTPLVTPELPPEDEPATVVLSETSEPGSGAESLQDPEL